jgi:anti-anti-sigma regulatory factor
METVILIESELDLYYLFGKMYFEDLTLDFAEISHFSTQGYSYLLRLDMIIERDGFKLKLINVCSDVRIEMQYLKIDRILDIDPI